MLSKENSVWMRFFRSFVINGWAESRNNSVNSAPHVSRFESSLSYQVDCSQPLYFLTHGKEESRKRARARSTMGREQEGERSEPDEGYNFFVPTPYPGKSSVWNWRPTLSQFYPRVQQSNKIRQDFRFELASSSLPILSVYSTVKEKYEEIKGCEQSTC